MKKIILLCACLVVATASPGRAQAGGPEVVTVKVREGFHSLQIIVSRGTGKGEVFNFPSKDLKAEGAPEAATQQVLATLYREGYTLKGTYGGGSDYFGNSNTLIFTKEK
ncbi:MAG: hypothetical protein NVS3B25_35730 [Hymenobacter sp.]